MAKKKNIQAATKTPETNKQSHQQKDAQPVVRDFGNDYFKKPSIQVAMVACIALLTWLFYNVCLNNQFTNWDDPGYIKDNALIKDISPEGLSHIFSTAVMGNYHPITILSYAIEYSYVRLQPWLYHLDSLLFHILVTMLVYWFANLLTKRPVAAAITALLFGLHPMHVESIAWLAGRKDVVYSTFYIAACIAYVYYIRAAGVKKWGLFAGVIILFVCSLLSKPVAVVLPFTLLLIDYYEQRKAPFSGFAEQRQTGIAAIAFLEERKIYLLLFIEKIPFFIISFFFGQRSLVDQRAFGSLDTQNVSHNFLERICLGCYALVTYLWKAVAPFGLCNFYPYPEKPAGGTLSILYALYPLGVAALIFIIWKMARKNRVIIFGVLFLMVNIILLLQFIPVGGAILADRYTYIPYMGLFFIAGWFVSETFEPGYKKEVRYAATIITLGYALFLGYLSNERCKVWYDTTSLWRDEIDKEPVRAPNAYNNLGFNYFNKFNDAVDPNERKIYYDSAYQLLSKAIELQPGFANPYISIGELLRSVGNFPEAKIKYYTAIGLQNVFENGNAYLGLGIIYAISRNFDSSEYCFRMALKLKPYFPEAHSNFGNFYDMTGRQDSALVEYGRAIAQNPDMVAPYLNRARTLQRIHRCPDAMKDFGIALELSPGMGEIYYSRSYCYTQDGNKALALQDVKRAISLGFTRIDKNYYQMLKK